MTNKLRMTSAQLNILSRMAENSLPNESCAFLLGHSSESQVLEIMPLTNADLSPYSFSVEPKALLDAYDRAEKQGLQVIGIFHSHPCRPSPSETDLQFMEINPVVWLIYSSTEKKFAAFIFEDKMQNVELAVKD